MSICVITYWLFIFFWDFQVYVAQPLDREKQDLYSLTVTATDGKFTANTTVTITVLDVNGKIQYLLFNFINLKKVNFKLFTLYYIIYFCGNYVNLKTFIWSNNMN